MILLKMILKNSKKTFWINLKKMGLELSKQVRIGTSFKIIII
jgi:hypothetical protein